MTEACPENKPQDTHILKRLLEPWCLSALALFSVYYVLRFYEPNRNYLQFEYVSPAILILLILCLIVYLVFSLSSPSIYCAALSSLTLVLCLSSFSFLHAIFLQEISSWLRAPLLSAAANDVSYFALGIAILVISAWRSISKIHARPVLSICRATAACLIAWPLFYVDFSSWLPDRLSIEIISALICVIFTLTIIILFHHFPFLYKYSKQLIQMITVILSTMVLTVIVQLLSSNNPGSGSSKPAIPIKFDATGSHADGTTPDVVYILLDGLGREDSLKKSGIDISGFSKDLESLGFFLPSQSEASYVATDITLAGVLNYDFVSNLGIKSREQSRAFIKNNRLIPLFQAHHYRTFSMSLFYYGKDIGATTLLGDQDTRGGEFVSGLLNQTIYLALRPLIARQFQQWYSIEKFDQFYTFTSEAIQSLRDERYFSPRQPTFLFIHLLYAHEPFVFHADGTFRTPEGGGAIESERSTPMANRISALQGQLDYLNKSLETTIKNCLAERRHGRPIVFLLQGDHGPGSLNDRGKEMAFAAYYFPDRDYSLFRKDTTPIQASRVLVRKLFVPDLDTKTIDDPSPSPEIRLFCPKR